MTEQEATYHDARAKAAETMYETLLQAAQAGRTHRTGKREPWQITLTMTEGTLNLIAALLIDAADLHRTVLTQ